MLQKGNDSLVEVESVLAEVGVAQLQFTQVLEVVENV